MLNCILPIFCILAPKLDKKTGFEGGKAAHCWLYIYVFSRGVTPHPSASDRLLISLLIY